MRVEEVTSHPWPRPEPPPGASVWPDLVGRLVGYGSSRRAAVRPYVIPHLILRGSGTFRSEAGTFPVTAGDMFTLWPGVAHEFWESPEDPWQFYWMRLSGPGSEPLGRAWGFGPERPVRPAASVERSIQVFGEMFRYWGRPERRDPFTGLSLLFELVAASSGRQTATGDDPAQQLVRRCQATIDSLIETDLNVNQLAELVGTARSTLWRAFRDVLGITVVEYIRRARIERGKQLLAHTTLKVSAIAPLCGFRDPKYFQHCFRQQEGVSPGRWREGRVQAIAKERRG